MLKRMTLYISTEDGMVGYCAVCITGDGVVDYRNADLIWGRCGWEWGNRSLLRTQWWVWCCRTLLETMLKRMTLHISTGDAVVGFDAVYLYWRRCGRIPNC